MKTLLVLVTLGSVSALQVRKPPSEEQNRPREDEQVRDHFACDSIPAALLLGNGEIPLFLSPAINRAPGRALKYESAQAFVFAQSPGESAPDPSPRSLPPLPSAETTGLHGLFPTAIACANSAGFNGKNIAFLNTNHARNPLTGCAFLADLPAGICRKCPNRR